MPRRQRPDPPLSASSRYPSIEKVRELFTAITVEDQVAAIDAALADGWYWPAIARAMGKTGPRAAASAQAWYRNHGGTHGTQSKGRPINPEPDPGPPLTDEEKDYAFDRWDEEPWGWVHNAVVIEDHPMHARGVQAVRAAIAGTGTPADFGFTD